MVKPGTGVKVSGPQQRILDALAYLETIGVRHADRIQLAFLSDASPKSSAFTNNLGSLRTAEMIDYPSGGRVALLPLGRGAAKAPNAPKTSDELRNLIRARVPGPQWRILSALIGAYPSAIERGKLADLAEASATSSAYTNNLGALRSLGLIDYPERGSVAAQPILFLEADQ
ncbi:MAG: hypothetical protein KBC46_03220 [Ferrovibrio sp.]|nr:hypothetical protein [Ferrovibrio sp.]